MALLDDLAAEAKLSEQPNCRLCIIVDSLPKDEARVVRDIVRHNRLGNYAVAEVLTKNGHPISESAIRRHKKAGHP